MSTETTDNRPFCDLPTDGTCVPLERMLTLPSDCQLPAGSCFGIAEIITDKHGHEVEGDWKKDSHGDWVPMTDECTHPDTPEYKAEHAHNKTKMSKHIDELVTSTDTGTATDAQTIAVVDHPHVEVKPPPKPPFSLDAAMPMIGGALAGVISSVGGPMLMNFAKNLLKGKFKKPGGDSSEQREEEKQEEPTDCKTHQLKSNAKLLSISKRITSLETKMANMPAKVEEKDEGFSFDPDDFDDFKDRIEKLEKMLAKKNK